MASLLHTYFGTTKEPSVSISDSMLPAQQSRKSTPLAQMPGPSAPPAPEETVRTRPSTKG